MKIWIVNHYALPPGSMGGPTRHLGISRALRDRGHEVTVIASLFDHYARADHRPRGSRRWTIEDIDGVRYVWIATPPYGGSARRVLNMAMFAQSAASIGSTLPGPDPDVVIGSSPHLLTPLAAKRIAARRRSAFIMEVRDLWPQSLVDLGELSARNPVIIALAALERHLYRTADALMTVLPAAAEHFSANGVPGSRLRVVPNGVAIGDDATLPSAHEGMTAIYAGTMGLANGLDQAVDAADILQQRGRSDIRIRLVGAGPERQRLQARAASLDNVSVEPPVASIEVPALLREADAGLLILRDSPVFRWGISPTKLFDYMAASLPVVTSVRAPSDIASDIGAGMAAVPGDPASLATTLERMADLSVDMRRDMGARGRRHVEEHHSFEALAAQVEAVALAAVTRHRGMAA